MLERILNLTIQEVMYCITMHQPQKLINLPCFLDKFKASGLAHRDGLNLKKTNMKIPNSILEKREHGDVLAIVKQSGLSKPTVSKALNKGACTRKVFFHIKKYFENIL